LAERRRALTRARRSPPQPICHPPRLGAFVGAWSAAPAIGAKSAPRSRRRWLPSPADVDRTARARPLRTIGATAATAGTDTHERTRRADVLDRPGRSRVQPPRLRGHLCGVARAHRQQAARSRTRAPAVRRPVRGSSPRVERGTRDRAAAGHPRVVRALGDAARRRARPAAPRRRAWGPRRGALCGASLGRVPRRVVRAWPGRAQRARGDRDARRALAPVRGLVPGGRHAVPAGTGPHVGGRAARAGDPARGAGAVLRRRRAGGDARPRSALLLARDPKRDPLPGVARVGDRGDLPGADCGGVGVPRSGIGAGGTSQGAGHRGKRAVPQRALRAQPWRLSRRRARVTGSKRRGLFRRAWPTEPLLAP
jgi:hypothetical protein